MAFVYVPGVAEFSSTSGTGFYQLDGALADAFRFGDRMAAGDECWYWADDTAQSEYGRGTFAAPNILYRTEVLYSSNNDQPVVWPQSGRRTVRMVQLEALPSSSVGLCAQALIMGETAAEWQYRPYPIAIYVDGTPEANQKVRLAVTEPIMFEEDFANSWAFSNQTPTAFVFTILINRIRPPLELGQIDFTNGFSEGVWVSTDNAKQYLVPGDIIEFVFPADVDATISDLSITARGLIVCQTMAIRFCGGTFPGYQVAGTDASSILQFTLPNAPASADTIFMAGWMGHFTTEQGHNLVLVYSNSSDHFVGITIGDGTTIPEGSFAFVMVFYDSSGSEVVSGFVEIPVDLTDGWHSFAISLRASTQTLRILVDSTLYTPGADLLWLSTNEFKGVGVGLIGHWQLSGAFVPPPGTYTDTSPVFTVDSSGLIFHFNPLAPDASFYNFLMAIDDVFVDLSDAATVARLFGATNTVVDWGTQGELITGNIPALYFIGDAKTFRINRGNGGDPTATSWLDGGPADQSVRVQNFLPLPP